MIKIFNATDTDFSTAGNIIINPLYCHETKKKSLNGWYIEVEIPIKYKEYIKIDNLCVVKTKSKLKPQAFRITDSITYTTRKIKFTAEHVMFDARRYILLDARPTKTNGLNGLKYINERTDKISPFSIYSNVETINTAYFIRKTLLEAWEVFEERWGGVFDADNWDISFKQSVGNDNGETIIYGKNMQGFEIFEDWSNVCTKLLPVGYDGLLLPEKYLTSETQYEIPYTKVIDFQTELESEEQTEENLLAELRTKAVAYLEENCIPKVSYTVNSNVKNDLEIGDKIKVLHPFVEIFTEVLEYEYDLISKKVKSLTFGNYTRDVKTKFDNIKNTITQINQVISKQEVIINDQTNLINSLNKNGYVYIDDNEILILDKLPKEKAENVWRIGMAGIGFSSNGYEGPFETAITMDGKINADFITTGTLATDRIEGLSNFITNTNASISAIEIEQGKITTTVSSLEKTTVKTVQVQYALGNSTTEAPTEGWSTTAPTWESGKYMWQRTVTTYSDDTTKTSTPTCIQGAKGENGADGKDGTNGKDGANGKDGTNGKDGADGKSIGDVINYYLATSLSSGVTTSTSGWTTSVQSISSSKKYLWNYEVIKYTDGTTASTSTPCVIGVYGDKGTTGATGATGAKGDKGDTGATGKGIESVQDQYYLSTSNTSQAGGSWKNSQDTWEEGKYYWIRSLITWTDNTVTYTEPILAEGINNANESIETVKTSVAEQNIEIGSIKQTVSETQTVTANNYNELKTKFDDYAPKSDIITIQNSVEKIQTDTYTKTEINTKLTDGSVTKVQTTAGTFGEDGLTIEKTNAKTKGKFNEKGMQVVDATGSSEEILLFAGYDEATDETIVKSKNMTVEKYLVVGANCRFEDYENPVLGGKGTGVFSL